MASCIGTTKTPPPQITSLVVVVGLFCLSFVFVCVVVFSWGVCLGLLSLWLGCCFVRCFVVLVCLCCGACIVCVVVVSVVVVGRCWYALLYRHKKTPKSKQHVGVVVGLFCLSFCLNDVVRVVLLCYWFVVLLVVFFVALCCLCCGVCFVCGVVVRMVVVVGCCCWLLLVWLAVSKQRKHHKQCCCCSYGLLVVCLLCIC